MFIPPIYLDSNAIGWTAPCGLGPMSIIQLSNHVCGRGYCKEGC